MLKQDKNQNIKTQLKKIEKRLEKIENFLSELSSLSFEDSKVDSVINYDEDELTDKAIKIVSQYKRASAYLLQRRLSIGYARAARILDILEKKGIVSSSKWSEPRKVLLKSK